MKQKVLSNYQDVDYTNCVGLQVRNLNIFLIIVTLANQLIVTLVQFFDILEINKVVRRESIFYRSHVFWTSFLMVVWNLLWSGNNYNFKFFKATKGVWWMPWLWEAMKDVVSCDKLREAAHKRYIRRSPNGTTRYVEDIAFRKESQPRELKHLSTGRKRK